VIVTPEDAPRLERVEDIEAVYKNFKAKVVAGSVHERYVKQIQHQTHFESSLPVSQTFRESPSRMGFIQ
jgi:prephenate dehydrogenase